jgi:hypothetical protein
MWRRKEIPEGMNAQQERVAVMTTAKEYEEMVEDTPDLDPTLFHLDIQNAEVLTVHVNYLTSPDTVFHRFHLHFEVLLVEEKESKVMKVTRDHPEESLSDKNIAPSVWRDIAGMSEIYVRDDFRSWVQVAFWNNNTLTNTISQHISQVRVYSLFLSYLYTGCSRRRFRSMLRYFFLQHLQDRRTYLEAILLYVSYRELFSHVEDVTLPNTFLDGKYDNNLALLLEQGYPVNNRVESGDTPLQCAIAYESVFTIRLLIRYGANVNDRDAKGRTLIQLACIGGNSISVKLLLTCGADVQILSQEGHNVLYYALQSANVEIMTLLLQHGFGVNSFDGHYNHVLDWLTEMPRHIIDIMLPPLLHAGVRLEYAREVSQKFLLQLQ